jgi:MYXO-CTERM domain-containing protein
MKVGILAVVGVALAASSAMGQLGVVGPIFNSVPGTWTDITGTGTNLNLGDNGVADVTATIGNRVFRPGNLRIWTDGALAWGTPTPNGPTLAGFTNQTIPEPFGTPPALSAGYTYLLPYWDDLDNNGRLGEPTPVNSDVYWQESGDTLIVQWNNLARFVDGMPTADRASFQVQIFRDDTNNHIYMQTLYDPNAAPGEGILGPSFMGGASATVGYVSPGPGINNGENSLWGFNGEPNGLMNGTVLTMTPAPGGVALLGLGALLAGRRRRA